MKTKALPVVLAAALMFAATHARAAPPGDVGQLAAHPSCAASGGAVYVRGAVAVIGSQEPVAGATVTLKYGGAVHRAKTNAAGIYQVTFRRTEAREVREIETTLAAPTGTSIPVEAREGTSICIVPNASVGNLQQVK